MKRNRKQMGAADNSAEVMEAETISKNAARLKSRMNKNKLLFFTVAAVIFALVCNSCISTKKFFAGCDNVMQEWVGQTENQLYWVYGNAMKTQGLSQNRKNVAYEYRTQTYIPGVTVPATTFNGRTTPGYSTPGYNLPLQCELFFTIENGIITNARYSGQLGALSEYIKRPSYGGMSPAGMPVSSPSATPAETNGFIVQPYTAPVSVPAGSAQPPTTTYEETCSMCNGTGEVVASGVSYVGGTKWCAKCSKDVPESHYHTTCNVCNGKGKRTRIK